MHSVGGLIYLFIYFIYALFPLFIRPDELFSVRKAFVKVVPFFKGRHYSLNISFKTFKVGCFNCRESGMCAKLSVVSKLAVLIGLDYVVVLQSPKLAH